MAYGDVIGKLNTLKENLTTNKSAVDKVDIDGSWKGSAHDKQSSNIKDLGSGVDSQVSNIDNLIVAMKAADLYDAAKKDYETAQTNRNGLDKEAENYQSLYNSYSSAMEDAQKTMDEQKKAAEAALGSVGDSYESKLSDISTTDLKDTTFVVLSSAVAELAPDAVDVDKNASQASEWSNIGNSSSSGNYSSTGGNYSSNGSYSYSVGTKNPSSSFGTIAASSTKDAASSLTDLVETDMAGKEIEIPNDVKQGGYTVTGYDYWVQSGDVMVWASGTNQEKVSEIWKKQGSRFKHGIAVINVDGEDRYLVAVTTTFGQVGDCIDVKLEDGSIVKCIIGDSKGSGADTGSKWGHPMGDGSINVLEFEVERATTLKLDNPTTEKWGLDWDSSKRVESIKNQGSIIGARELDNTIQLANDSKVASTTTSEKSSIEDVSDETSSTSLDTEDKSTSEDSDTSSDTDEVDDGKNADEEVVTV